MAADDTNESTADIAERVKEQLAGFGSDLADAGIVLGQRTATVQTQFGALTTQPLVVERAPPIKTSTGSRILKVHGRSVTGPEGSSRFSLSAFVCEPLRDLGTPVGILATPQTNHPIYLTATSRLVFSLPPGPVTAVDVAVEVFAWGPNGNPRSNIPFNFMATLPGSSIHDLPG